MWSRVVDWPGLTRYMDGAPRGAHRKLIARGEQIAKSNWAPEAIRNSVDAIIDATKIQADRAAQGSG